MTDVAEPDVTPELDDDPVAAPGGAAPEPHLGWGTSRRATTVAWVLFALVSLVVGRSVFDHDFRDTGIRGDTASFVLQAVSLAYQGHNLSYDKTDLDHFRALHWEAEPRGAHIQRDDGGWAFAKPYGYSAFLAPFLRGLGPAHGLAVANLLLLAIIAACSTATMWLRYRGAVVPIVVGVFLFGSNLFFYAYHAYTELFLAAVVAALGYCLLRGARSHSTPWVAAGVAISAILVSEKAPMGVVVVPAIVVALFALPGWWKRLIAVGAGAVTFALAIFPYLFYSDFTSWNPYGGARYYIDKGAPFGGANVIYPVDTSETFSLSYLRRSLGSELGSTAKSAGYYVVGRHTGLALYTPIAVVILVLAIAVVIHRRRSTPVMGAAILGGIAAYVGFYVLLFPHNYYGGGQSFGNRYFLQMAPMVIPLAVAMGLQAKHLVWGAALSLVIALTVLRWEYGDPSAALLEIWRTNPLQRWFPIEVNQEYRPLWGGS
ncbi:hypothetical protein [Aquihabitans sp. McL0605]|uniref:hypothetical protein n=1 Tax=Aquihabitans sp. McL0605 TaxID=3415671 RepID=UPI003CF6361B